MNRQHTLLPHQDAHPFAVSPILEFGSPMPLSTHWMPLHELISFWTHPDTVQLPEPVAPLLTAIGHALFALGRETRALRVIPWHGSTPSSGTLLLP